MKAEDLSKNTCRAIWKVIVNMPNLSPVTKIIREAKTEDEILKKLEELKY